MANGILPNLIPADFDGALSVEQANLLGLDNQTSIVVDYNEEDANVDEGESTVVLKDDWRK
jgi:hypothetical protein